MSAKSYPQYCAIARALETVGDRWVLLIVRELATGPKRNTDIRDALPTIATNILVERLRALVDAGLVVRRELPPPAARHVFELTDRGWELMPVLDALAHWGMPLLPERRTDDEVFRLPWTLLALSQRFVQRAARRQPETYEFRLDDQVAHIVVSRRGVARQAGPAADPTGVVQGPAESFIRWAGGATSLETARAAGLQIDDETAERFTHLFPPPAHELALLA